MARVAELQKEIKVKLEALEQREKADAGPLNEWLVSIRRKAINKSLEESPDGIVSYYFGFFSRFTRFSISHFRSSIVYFRFLMLT